MSFDYQSYELGKRSAARLAEAIRRFMETGDEAILAPYLAGGRPDPACVEELMQILRPLFAWKSLAWAYSPRGPQPSAKLPIVVAVLCKSGIPLDEEFLASLRPPTLQAGEGEEEAGVE